MRPVAKLQFVCSDSGPDLAGSVEKVIQEWADAKFSIDSSGLATIKSDGREALFESRTEVDGSFRHTAFNVFEPVENGRLHTELRLLQSGSLYAFQCSLGLDSDGGLTPPGLMIRSPRFVRNVIELPAKWQVGVDGERIFPRAFDIERDNISTLLDLLTSPHRRLPVVLVSQLRGEVLAGNVHEKISQDTCGLAHTCLINEDVSWALTKALGREWSCYNGSVRLYWPFRLNRGDPRAHPFWTADYLLRDAPSEQAARETLRERLTQALFEASTFVTDEPAFARFEAAKASSRRDRERAEAAAETDADRLAALYSQHNDELRRELELRENEIAVLRQNVESLTIALRSSETRLQTGEAQAPPDSVDSAVTMAEAQTSGKVLFGRDVRRHLQELNPTAGPPDKILRYLLELSNLSEALENQESLGTSIPLWLKGRNVDCSIESLTTRSNAASMRQRTWKVGDEDVTCDLHLKPSDGVSPDLCARIYFAVTDEAPRIRVGYVGRHF